MPPSALPQLPRLTAGALTPATAAGDFGDHASTCAQAMGCSGDLNAGMHQGRHGWDPIYLLHRQQP